MALQSSINIRTMKNAGFTLIEVTLVMALSSLMLVTIFAGQQQLQDEARFDAAVDSMIQEIAYARNYAMSGVNEMGAGNDPNVVLAGQAFDFDNANPPNFPLTEIKPLYDVPDANGDFDMTTLSDWPTGEAASACPAAQHPNDPNTCKETFFHLPDIGMTVQNAQHVAIYFVNTGAGGLKICRDVGMVYEPIPTACSTTGGAPIDIVLQDSAGFSATIQVDAYSGFAKRL